MQQITQNFADPVILRYLQNIITVAVDVGGNVYLPKLGIPRQSALSPFFGALYLSDLDKAFTNRPGIFYLRYMDDIIILTETKRQYQKARKSLFVILQKLRLRIAPHKTKMGAIRDGFHFLGVNFAVARTSQGKIQVALGIHQRTSRRAYAKIQALRFDAVNPAHLRAYLMRWAAWWHHVVNLKLRDLIYSWICCVTGGFPGTVWVGAEVYWHLALNFPKTT